MTDQFDPMVFFLGVLCQRKHDYQGTGRSLRYVDGSRTCCQCKAERNRAYYLKHKDKILEQQRGYQRKRRDARALRRVRAITFH